ncbi:unnamed protein product, partial [Oikopleura dioica]
MSDVQQNCGAPSAASNRWMGMLGEKIVGGQSIFDEKAWPWLVSIDGNCGASLIDERHVLTAAHCVDLSGPIAGIDKNKVLQMELHHEAIYEHYDFVRGSLVNDIALIRLKKAVKLDDSTNVVCLPEKNERVPSGTEAYVAGWGYMNENAFWTQDLAREVMVPIVPQQWCDEAYTRKINEETEVCAGFKAGGKDACQGDSGGPLVTRDSGKGATLHGLVSWGSGCARAGKYGVYTRVSGYIDWIEEAKDVLANCKAHKWCQDGSKTYNDLAGPGQLEKEDGGEPDAQLKKPKKPAKKPVQKDENQSSDQVCKGVRFSQLTKEPFICGEEGCTVSCAIDGKTNFICHRKKGWRSTQKKVKASARQPLKCSKPLKSFEKCGPLAKSNSQIQVDCRLNRKGRPDKCTVQCQRGTVEFVQQGTNVSPKMAKMEGIMCLKRGGYGFSKRNNGMGSFSCTSDGNNRGTIEENVAEKIQHSEEPKKSFEADDYDYQQNYVADEAKVVGGGDMDHDFFFGDGKLQNDPNNPMVTDLVNFEISIGGKVAGDISLGLFGFAAPKTAKNFAELSMRPIGEGYLNSIFHRVISGFMAQGGDFTHATGIGGHSIY